MTGNCHVRCGAGENPEITSKDYLSLFGQIPDFDKVIAFVRSMGMSLNVIIQNLAQLKARYEKTWEVITGNCDTTIFLGGKEESTLKSISEQLGKETIDVRGTNRTKGRQSSTSENNSILGRELMQPNELATMPISDCIVLIRSHNPIYGTKYPIEKHPNYCFLGDSGKFLPPFDVSTVHSVTFEEFQAEQQAKRQKADTNVNSGETGDAAEKAEPKQTVETVTVFFKESDTIRVSADSVLPSSYEEAKELLEEARLNAEPAETHDEVQYNQSAPEYSIPQAWESAEFGEPIPKREEEEKDEEAEIPPVTASADTQHYGVPDETPTAETELTQDAVVGVAVIAEEQSPQYAPENALFHEADFFDLENSDLNTYM